MNFSVDFTSEANVIKVKWSKLRIFFFIQQENFHHSNARSYKNREKESFCIPRPKLRVFIKKITHEGIDFRVVDVFSAEKVSHTPSAGNPELAPRLSCRRRKFQYLRVCNFLHIPAPLAHIPELFNKNVCVCVFIPPQMRRKKIPNKVSLNFFFFFEFPFD